MSLRVWLPLNGDLENKGLDGNITVTNNNATVDNNGKIGKCYYFNGSAQYLQLSETLGDIYSGDFSWAVWLKPEDDTRGIIISEYSSVGSSNVTFELLANRVIRVYWNDAPDINTGVSIEKDKWSHVAITKKDDTIKVYINGELKTIRTQTLSNRPSTSKIRIGDDYRGGTSVSYMGYMNDVRIYDHCLSVKQIKEISKGLVLHYKLDDKYTESTVNLCNGLVKGRCTVVVGDTITNTGENVDTYWFIKPKEALIGGATYTVSCQLQGFSSNSNYISWGVCAQSGANHAGSWKTYNGYNEFTFIMPNGLDGSTANIYFDDNGGVRTQIFTISKVQLEKKDHATPYVGIGGVRNGNIIYDSSGYQNNGMIINDIEINTNSPKYIASTVFNGTNYIKLTPPTSEIKTLSLWVNWETIPSGQSVIFLDYASKIGLGLMSTGISCGTSGPGSYKTFSKANLTANTWYHFVVINPDEEIDLNRKLYINGIEQVQTSSASNWTYNVNQIQIGKRNSTSDGFIGKLSDLRLYSTALSEADIKELYQTSALIDRNQNLYVRELVEI